MAINYAELQDDVEQEGGSENFLKNFVKMPEGNGIIVVRILPPGNDLPMMNGGLCMWTRIHNINGRRVHCRREKVKGRKYPMGDCKICEHYSWLYDRAKELKDNGDKDQAEALIREARAIKPIQRFYLNVIVRKMKNDQGVEESNVGPLILSVGETLWNRVRRALLGDEAIQEPPLGDITDPVNGRDFKIVKEMATGSNGEKYPSYDNSKFLDPSPLGTPPQVQKWMNELHDLHALRIVKSSEEVVRELKIHLGVEKDERKNTYDPSQLGAGLPQLATETVKQPTFEPPFAVKSGGYSPDALKVKEDVIIDPTPSIAMNDESFYNAIRNFK